MTLLTDARHYVLGRMPAVDGVTLYPGPVSTPVPPCYVIAPGADWVAVRTSTAYTVQVTVHALVAVTARPGDALARLEDMTEQVLLAFPEARQVAAPEVDDMGALTTLHAMTTIPVLVTP